MTLTQAQFFGLLPLLITSLTAILVMLGIAVRRHHSATAAVTVIGLTLALLSVFVAAQSLPQTVTPLLRIDGYACFYMVLILVATLACATLAHAYLETYPGNKEELYLLLVLAAAGGLVLVSARHLASLFIGLELLSVPVYAMVGYSVRVNRSLEAAMKYLVLSAAASAFLLFGMALLYVEAGTLTFAELGPYLVSGGLASPLVLAGLALMLVALGFKLSLVPFHLWTPDVYEGAPAPVGAFLATASKVAVFAVLLRFVLEVGALYAPMMRNVLAAIAFVSILGGNLLALTQTNVKRLLGYSSIAHFGYLLVALVAGGMFAVEAVAVYLATYVVTTLAAFGVVALMSSPFRAHDADKLPDIRGLFWRRPYLTAVMTVAMLSLAGIPLTAGFIGKFYIVTAGVGAQLWWLVGAVVVGSAIGLYYYLRVMVVMFLREPGMARFDAPTGWEHRAGGVVLLCLAALMLILGMFPQPLLDVLNAAHLLAVR